MKRFLAAALLVVPLAGCETSSDNGQATTLPAVPVVQGTPSDLADFVGARAGQAERGLGVKGYRFVRSEGLTSFWWNPATATCARIVTSNGRYSAITSATAAECNQNAAAAPVPAAAPTQAERACLRDVAGVTGNTQVVALSSLFSQAGTEVIIGVGPQQAKWRCIAYENGTTAGIQSLTNEGSL